VPVPFETLPDGRKYLTAKQLIDDPVLRNFVRLFEKFFEFPANQDIAIFNIGATGYFPAGKIQEGDEGELCKAKEN
jgi:hypothetical protein